DLDVIGAQAARGGQHVADQRAPADGMQHLGEARLHARSLACSEDDDCESVPSHAPPPGLEPRPHSSKGCRAAITPRRTAALRPPDKSATPRALLADSDAIER